MGEKLLVAIVAHVCYLFLGALVWWLLWNHALAPFFNRGLITYWQTFGLLFAAHLFVRTLRSLLGR